MKIINFWGINTLSVLILFAGFFIGGAAQAATITVDSNDDIALPSIDGNCTLREAIKAAEDNAMVDGCVAGSGVDIIEFDEAITVISIQAGNLSDSVNRITESLTIKGPGSSNLVIDGDDSYDLFYFNSPGNDQIFEISDIYLLQGLRAVNVEDGETLNVKDVVFEANTRSAGAAINISPAETDPTHVTIQRSTFTGNRAQTASGGGAIRGSLNSNIYIEDSSFYSNRSTHDGGAIEIACNFGVNSGSCQLDIERSTFSGNRADRGGGAIQLRGNSIAPVEVAITDTTITENIADADKVISSSDDGGGIRYQSENVTILLTNSVIAGNIDDSTSGSTNSDDISAQIGLPTGLVMSNGFNFIGNNANVTTEFPAGTPNVNNDYVGTSATILPPNLQALSDNGGPTRTHLPLAGSPLIDAGNCAGASHDQRGFGDNTTNMRVIDDAGVANGPGSDGCDIGAVELGAELIDLSAGGETCYAIKAASGNVTVFCL